MAKDFLLDENGDSRIENGDFVVGGSDAQNLALLLKTNQGEWKQWPLVGVGLNNWTLDDGSEAELRHRIAIQAEYDGARIERIDVDYPNVTVKGYYPDGT